MSDMSDSSSEYTGLNSSAKEKKNLPDKWSMPNYSLISKVLFSFTMEKKTELVLLKK